MTVAYSLHTGIAPMPTSARARAVLLTMLPNDVDGQIVELGAGWGGLALALARHYPSRPVLAVELSPLPWLVLRLRSALARTPNLRILRCDFYDLRLDSTELVVCYLFRQGMERLKPKLEAELRPGAVVVSHSFAIPGWHPEAEAAVGDWHAGRIYRYRVVTASAAGSASAPSNG